LASLGAYYAVQVSPEKSWIFGFIGYSIPFLLIAQCLLVLYWLLRRSWKIVVPIVALVMGWQHVQSTIQVRTNPEVDGLNVINYNVRIFNVYKHLQKINPQATTEMIGWLSQNNADILCLQEYYNDPGSQLFNAEKKIKAGGFPYSHVAVNQKNRIEAEFGIAIFSKHPIINCGNVSFDVGQENKAIFADIIYDRNDTIRVYNVHLYSMKLQVDDLIKEEEKRKKLHKTKNTFYQIRKGFIEHAKEADILKEHILSSPYPVILTGDFNEMPYSYSYLTFKSILQNSFEKAGNGLGFTYRENPSFIRIDNQFSSLSFNVLSHKVHKELNYSDHYPVSVFYRLENNKKE
jgi:endonuclease/exonuclease/phosphatase family metal-dependent hydrolase